MADKIKIRKKELHQTDMLQIDYCPKCPILVDGNYNIIAGNALYNALPDIVDCIIFDSALNPSVIATEQLFSELPNALQRYQKLSAGILLMQG